MPSHTPQSPSGEACPVNGMNFGAKPELFALAKKLRAKQTLTEAVLWNRIRNKQLEGHKFRRQHPIAFWIADFYCHKLKYVIELDGEYHSDPKQKLLDDERDVEMLNLGIHVRRISDNDILSNIEKVIELIKNDLKAREGLLL